MREPACAIDANAMPAPPQALLERLKDYGQEDAFAFWDELSADERDLLIKDIESLDLPRIDRIIRCSLRSQALPVAAIEPVPENIVATVDGRTIEDRERWWKIGLKAIRGGKLAVLLLSGGQGTRLGSYDPKGCFNIGLPSGKSLFQLQAERILRVQRLAAEFMSEGSAAVVPIHWYIMTSPFTDEATRKFFESHKYFGLEPDQVTFFQQGTIPCISKDGRFILESPYKVAKSPDGNGGVYMALKYSRLLEDMASRGIKYVDCYGVDNALVRVADPTFLGYFIEQGVAAAAKVVKKEDLDEERFVTKNTEMFLIIVREDPSILKEQMHYILLRGPLKLRRYSYLKNIVFLTWNDLRVTICPCLAPECLEYSSTIQARKFIQILPPLPTEETWQRLSISQIHRVRLEFD